MTEEEDGLNELYDAIINEREKLRFFNWSTVDSQLPITMNNGHIIESTTFACTQCGAPTISGENLRGEFHTVTGGDLRLTGYGYCSICVIFCPVRQHYRQNEDGSIYIQTIPRDHPIPLKGADIIPITNSRKYKRRKLNGEKNKDSGKE